MSEEEVPAGVPAGPGGKLPDLWGAPAWPAPPPAPPTWWPQHYYSYEPPPPPRRTSRLKLVAVAVLLVVLGASAAATAVIATRGIHGTGSTSGAQAAIVDINTTLGQGAAAAGTGMVLTSSGEVLTNNHVIYGELSISVQVTSTGATYGAHVVGFDQRDDIAVLQLDGASGLATMPIGNSSNVQVGDSVTALGNALGRGGAPASAPGTVTALNQSITASDESGTAPLEALAGMIQINAPIKPGDSGGPLLNSSGQAIGMDTAASGGRRLDQTGAVEAFAIPINSALSVAAAIVKSPSGYQTARSGGFLGVLVLESTAPAGALVDGTQAGSPAASSGLVKGDVITGVGGATVTSVASLQQILQAHHPGDSVIVAWVTASGQDGQATVTLATPPPPPPQ
ncbi:MAG TPA: trypsin-like peptidase domain-containing protein [Candidatus Saccharimonadales bacterium]|nr:trypsin-like peptidase domain-containing protein [Candidatus Saccharimonadales bacterium]